MPGDGVRVLEKASTSVRRCRGMADNMARGDSDPYKGSERSGTVTGRIEIGEPGDPRHTFRNQKKEDQLVKLSRSTRCLHRGHILVEWQRL